MPKPKDSGCYLVTGYPGFIGKRLAEHIARSDPGGHLFLLAQPKFTEEARGRAKRLKGASAEVLTGDVTDLHLGLSGEEVTRVTDRVTDVFHLAAASHFTVSRDTATRVNVDGTRNVLELSRECPHLHRFTHFSTCHVAGDRVGIIAEDELDRGQSFRNAYEETKFQGEQLVARAAATLPVTVLRPSTVIGDSTTGEVDRFEGPYALAILLAMSPLVVPLPLPGGGAAPLNVVPVDFVVRAAWAISRDPRAAGKTFHLVDPSPMSTGRVYELMAERSQRRLPRFSFPALATDFVLRLPLLEKLARPQRAALSYVNQMAFFTSHATLELLDGTGVRCPPLTAYLDRLVAYVREVYRRRAEATDEVEDQLDEARG
ncbi:MAG TPA: SDR family oxidoreductase [Myxococcaceae bacterium]|nr:SDR family oxidoreductase [Myxococcaceae bacterium]